MRRFFVLLGTLAAASTTFHAAAQEPPPSIALNQYEQPVAGDAFLSVVSPWVGGHLEPRGIATLDFAKDPLKLVDEDGNEVANPVTNQLYLHLGFSFALWSRLGLSLDFPVALSQSGEEDLVNTRLEAADGANPGDLRFGLRGRIWGELDDPLQVGIGANLYIPTGPSEGYTGEGAFWGKPHAIVGGKILLPKSPVDFVYSVSAGTALRGSENPHTFTYQAAVGVLLLEQTLQVGPELFGAVAFEDKPLSQSIERKGSVNTELLFGAKYHFLGRFFVGVGGGPGLANGVGTPSYRLLLQVGYDPKPEKVVPRPNDRDGDRILDKDDYCPDVPGVKDPDPLKNGCPPDRDGDGVYDKDDACVDVPGVKSDDPKKNGCPPPGDKDGDGVMDPEDACPETPGVRTNDGRTNGCPPDRDRDGILDKDDACVDVPGVESADPKKNGCPPDKDGDGVLDPDDACPETPGVKDPNPKRNGCPKVVVTDTDIKIFQKIEFEFDKARILPESDSILDAVAETLKEHPEIALVEVQGHTDNKGKPLYNQQLSELRARSVRDALIRRGIEGKRLKSKGYGQAKPIDTNDTEEGRANNRRVEFQIVKRETQ